MSIMMGLGLGVNYHSISKIMVFFEDEVKLSDFYIYQSGMCFKIYFKMFFFNGKFIS